MKKFRIVFVHGRPTGHPLHAKYGRSITENFSVEDPWIRWHDKALPAPLRYFAWLTNALAFTSFKKRIIVSECLRITLVLSKYLSLGRLKLIILVDDESPYFIHSKFYSKVSLAINLWALKKFDGYICIGHMETELVHLITKRKKGAILTGFNGISSDKMKSFNKCQYNANSNRIVFIGNGPAGWRAWYKGVDLMIRVISILIDEGHDIYFDIAGEWKSETFVSRLSTKAKARIIFSGQINDLTNFLTGAALYLHTARGEAWGISVNEAMAAGVIPLVSEWTGAKECVTQVSEKLVVPLNEGVIYDRIKWFLQIPGEEKLRLSERCKEVNRFYTEEKAIEKFRECFDKISSEII